MAFGLGAAGGCFEAGGGLGYAQGIVLAAGGLHSRPAQRVLCVISPRSRGLRAIRRGVGIMGVMGGLGCF